MTKYYISIAFGAAFLMSAGAYANNQNGLQNSPAMTHGQQAGKPLTVASAQGLGGYSYPSYEDCASNCPAWKGQCQKMGESYECR